jgi:acetyl-CoA acyltransferase
MMNELPDFDKTRIDDVMVGNAMPEAEQGLNGTFNFVNGIKIEDVPGVTVNRYCASGLETIGIQPKSNQEWHIVLQVALKA